MKLSKNKNELHGKNKSRRNKSKIDRTEIKMETIGGLHQQCDERFKKKTMIELFMMFCVFFSYQNLTFTCAVCTPLLISESRIHADRTKLKTSIKKNL